MHRILAYVNSSS